MTTTIATPTEPGYSYKQARIRHSETGRDAHLRMRGGNVPEAGNYKTLLAACIDAYSAFDPDVNIESIQAVCAETQRLLEEHYAGEQIHYAASITVGDTYGKWEN